MKKNISIVSVCLLIFVSLFFVYKKIEVKKLFPGDYQTVINGVVIHYHVRGQGPVCFVQPGGPGMNWGYLQMPELEKFLTMVYIEPIGSGKSGKLVDYKGYSINRYLEDIELLRKRLKQKKVYLLGHSHGGYVALSYNLRYPNNLIGLILYGTSPTTSRGWVENYYKNLKWFEKEPWFDSAYKVITSKEGVKNKLELNERLKKYFPFYFADYTNNSEKYNKLINNSSIEYEPYLGYINELAEYDVSLSLRKVKAPSLVIVGEKDFICSPLFANIMYSSIPNSSLVVLKEAGHMAHFEQPQKFSKAVSLFVERTK